MANGKFVITIGDEGAVLLYLVKGKVVNRLFAAEVEHSQGFDDLFATDPKAPVTMLVDVLDQTYVRQTFPPVSQFSISSLIKRRLAREFSADDITGALSLGREEEGRKDWNYLFIALSNTPPLSLWIKKILTLPNLFTGIHPIPAEAAMMLSELAQKLPGSPQAQEKTKPAKKKEGKEGWQILVSHHKLGGFRQVVLKDGKLVFTRMAQPVGEPTPEVFAGNIEQEVLNALEYLKRLSFSEQDGIDIYVIVSDVIRQSVDVKRLRGRNVFIITPFEAATALGLEDAAKPEDHYGDVLLATYVGTAKKHVLCLQTKVSRQIIDISKAFWVVRAAAALIAAGLFGAATYYFANTIPLRKDVNKIERDMKNLESSRNTIQAKIDKLPYIADHMSVAVETYKQLREVANHPMEFVANIISVKPESVVIQRFDWQSSTFDSLFQGSNAGSKEDMTVTMDIHFRNIDGDLEKYLKIAENFRGSLLNKYQDYEIRYTKLPGGLQANEIVEISLGDGAKDPQEVGDSAIAEMTISGPIAVTQPDEQ